MCGCIRLAFCLKFCSLTSCCKNFTGAEDGYKNDGTGELESFNITCNSSRAISHFAYGITANMAAVFLYGSNFVPVKRVETGDGEHIIVYFSESLNILICVIFGRKLHFKCLLFK